MLEQEQQAVHQWPLDLSLGEIAAITGGFIARGAAHRRIAAFFHDSRHAAPGAMFIALKGENFDGHKFVIPSAEAGAAGALVAAPVDFKQLPNGFFLIRVADTTEALGALARARRRRWRGPLIAVAGSAGKTTTKEMIASALAARWRVHKTEANFNNLIGVPQTLFELRDDHEAAVVELGMNQRDELKRLTLIAEPDWGVLTNIGLAHVGMFGSEEALLGAKGDFIEYLSAAAPLVFNADCHKSRIALQARLGTRRAFGVGESPEAQARVSEIEPQAGGYRFKLEAEGKVLRIALPCFGRYNVSNAAAAAAVALLLGVEPGAIVERLGAFTPNAMRSQTLEIAGVRIIADCYNASPDATLAALRSLVESPIRGARYAILGDMLELALLKGSRRMRLEMALEELKSRLKTK
ncbi:MAG: UDP-N-acetylmuramoyl-tripeptide--D-alanyl-D-alanine ligase [Candidatus Sumerlaeota bacterium]|nr:UDP-N-acetylmuramoyl-tripeptide--D-alanyl-D-alanine ligase [Candidatus Sumerlaeota bacterium]